MRIALIAVAVFGFVAPSQALAAPSADTAIAKSFAVHAKGGFGGHVTRIGAFRIRRDPTLKSAQRVFGRPSSKKLVDDNLCVVDWRRLRLRISFVTFGLPGPGQTVCTAGVGMAQLFTARGRRFKTWRGLRVGDSSDAIPEYHPQAEFVENNWWLKSGTSPYGDSDEEFGVVRAIVANGRVNALKGYIGAAGD